MAVTSQADISRSIKKTNMRADLRDIIAGQPTQHSLNWYRVRLGKFTGSQVGRLMKRGKGGEYFAKDAMSYITEVVAERMLNTIVDCIKEFMPSQMMNEGIRKYGIRL